MERTASRSPQAHLIPDDGKPFKPYDVIHETTQGALVGTGTGVFIAALYNALSKGNVGAMSTFTRGAPLIGIAAASPAAYHFVSRTTFNLREKTDAWGAVLGGFAMGGILGLPFKRMPVVMAIGTFCATVQGSFVLFGNRLDSFKAEGDEFERKETIRRTTRLPVGATVAEIGEGRGIRPPGYEERRRERIQEKYGFEINTVKATADGS